MANNVSQEFFPKDTPQVQAVGKGKCGVAVVNTYYVGRMLAGRKGADNKALAEKVSGVPQAHPRQREWRRRHSIL